MAQGAPTERDPSQPGYALPDHEPSETAARQLVLRPRLAAFLWIIPISFCGLVLAGCNVIVLFSPDQPSDSRANFVWWALIGAVLLFAPVANFVNSEVRVSDAIVAKRGALRRYKRWPVSELRFIHPYVGMVEDIGHPGARDHARPRDTAAIHDLTPGARQDSDCSHGKVMEPHIRPIRPHRHVGQLTWRPVRIDGVAQVAVGGGLAGQDASDRRQQRA